MFGMTIIMSTLVFYVLPIRTIFLE